MSEIVTTYLLTDPENVIPMDREEFYAEQMEVFKRTGAPTRAVGIIDVFIFNSMGELIIQKRSFDKVNNPGLLDKSIGGHVRYGDTPDFSVMVETVQELQTPSIVLRGKGDFEKAYELLHRYLTTIGLIQHSESKIWILEKIMNGERVKIANKAHVYFGRYDGSIRPVDREAKGVLFYNLKELDQEMSKFPETFTQDIHVLFKELRPEIEEFLKLTTKQEA